MYELWYLQKDKKIYQTEVVNLIYTPLYSCALLGTIF